MSQKADEVYLRHILDAITQIEGYTAGVSREDFFRNRLLQDAVVRQVEIIGEAARQVSEELQARYPQVLWREIIGMRNRIVHAYFDLDLEAVWDTVQEDLPQLKAQAQKIVEEL
jgi:uncharacterized protein with HEPN domain